MNENYIILHGSFGSSTGNWFPWLKKQLELKEKSVDVPQMPIGVGIQNYDNWANEFSKLTINENTTIIAHSIAPIFVCKYLILNKVKVKKLIFVCGFNNYLGIDKDFDSVNEPMYIDNYPDIKNYCNNIVCYCESCCESLLNSNKNVLHILDLLFNENVIDKNVFTQNKVSTINKWKMRYKTVGIVKK